MSNRLAPRLGLVSCSVLLCVLAVYLDFWPAALVSWVPLVIALDQARVDEAMGLGLLHGIMLNGFGFYWVVSALCNVAAMTLPGALLVFVTLLVAQGGRTALISVLHVLGARRGWPQWTTFPLSLLMSELAYPLVFPWYSAHFAVPVAAWLQLAEFGGPLVVSLWLGVTNAAIAEAWFRRKRGWRPVLASLGAALAIIGIVTMLGLLQLAAIERTIAGAAEVRIGVAQGGVSPAHVRGDSTAVYKRLTRELFRNETRIDLVVWPESAVSFPVQTMGLSNFLRQLPVPELTGGSSPPLLLGMVLTDHDPHWRLGAERSLRNAAVLTLANGRTVGRYEKRYLVPVGESAVVSSLPFLSELLPVVNQFRAGEEQPTLELGEHRLGISICYEDILHRGFRDGVLTSRPHLLVNLTSDSWFAGSEAPRLHLSLASLRAIEHRRFLLRATTTGLTALVDPAGRVVWTLPEGKAAAEIVTARWLEGATAYGTLGDWPWSGLSGAVVVIWLFAGRKRRLRQA